MRNGFRWIRGGLAYRLHKPKRVLFDHLPKCAGTTISKYLSLHYPSKLIFHTTGRKTAQSIETFQSLPSSQRFRYELILGHSAHSLLELVHPDTIAVTILREPIDRIISHYYFVKQDQQHYLHDLVTQSNTELKDYPRISSELQNWYTTHFTGLSLKQVNSDPKEALRLATEVITTRYNIVGFQDDLAGVVKSLKAAANLRQPFSNRVKNKTRKRVTVSEISVDVRDAIARTNSVDVELFALLKQRAQT